MTIVQNGHCGDAGLAVRFAPTWPWIGSPSGRTMKKIAAVLYATGLMGFSLAVVGLVVSAGPAGAAPSCVGTTTVTCTFSYTGAADSFTVPVGITQVSILASGAQGGGGQPRDGGKGAQ